MAWTGVSNVFASENLKWGERAGRDAEFWRRRGRGLVG